jgi:cyclopropane-fatty-acyl-phospholipid synthase
MTQIGSSLSAAADAAPRAAHLAGKLQGFIEGSLQSLPWRVDVTDWNGRMYSAGRGEPHWSGRTLAVHIKTEDAARDLLRLDGMRFIERFLEGDVDLEGNLYILASIKRHASMGALKPWHLAGRLFKHFAFQNASRARVSVKSHYDIPQEALHVYLDRTYMSYSTGMWEYPERLDIAEVTRIGSGQRDDFDSLEKSMWRKFKDAADYVAPGKGDSVLDVGCGYGGQLMVMLENHELGKIVGWTHSENQVREGEKMLRPFDSKRWELNEGDYREDHRVYDHVTSTGMVSHVGPRGLIPYVRNIRRRIKTGGRYLHHAMMTSYRPLPIDFDVGIAFNKKYVWPGFHWFTLGTHIKALERNGFQVEGVRNLSRHYAKTTAAWYERMMAHRDVMIDQLGQPTFRAWQVFLAGITDSFLNRDTHTYRLYCVAV